MIHSRLSALFHINHLFDSPGLDTALHLSISSGAHFHKSKINLMSSRFIIWVLLVLVPFQSFAAVGLIQCQAPGVVAGHGVVSSDHKAHFSHVAGDSRLTTDHEHVGSPVVHPIKKSQTPASSPEAHHFHKMPCCSDAAIISPYSLPNLLVSEHFRTAMAPRADDLVSVFLKSPRRPPRNVAS